MNHLHNKKCTEPMILRLSSFKSHYTVNNLPLLMNCLLSKLRRVYYHANCIPINSFLLSYSSNYWRQHNCQVACWERTLPISLSQFAIINHWLYKVQYWNESCFQVFRLIKMFAIICTLVSNSLRNFSTLMTNQRYG